MEEVKQETTPEVEKKDEATPEAQEGKAKNFRAAWGRLLRFCKPWTVPIIIAVVLAAGGVVIRLVGVDQVGSMVEYIIAGDHDSVVRIGTLLAILFGIMFVMMYAGDFTTVSVVQKVAYALRKRISGKINKIPLSYYDKSSTGDVLSRVTNDVTTLETSLNFSISTLVASGTMIIGAAAFMFWTNWILALVAIGSSFIGFIIMGMVMARSQKHFTAQQKRIGDLNGHIEEYYTGHQVMKTSNARGVVGREFDELNDKLKSSDKNAQYYGGLVMPIMGAIGDLGFIAVCVVGGVLAFNGTIGFGVVAAFMLYVNMFTYPLAEIAQAAQHMQMAAASSERVFEFLDEEELTDESELTGKVDDIRGRVEFIDVKFGYKKDEPIIKGFNIDIPAGSRVAIVGPTGAGKTTMVNLLMKFYEADSGQIKVDGVCLSDMRRADVSALFGMVLQDTWLFEGTIRQNLLYNMNLPEGQEQEIIDRACAAAGVDHFIRTLPDGYETMLGEKESVSDGEKQLLTIARAFIKDAPLLILDEATSSVDTRTEVLIQEAMDRLSKGHTSFIIAHRLSTIKNADIILVMQSGDIVERGTHDQLLAKNGVYAELYNSQFAA
ncbi:MAG: ABC transporter ATP-binding protein/permease [Firmicutes bacterium]|nr:ABC transporter ATP-binding protein/permease [Bacillota bacterium]